MSQIKYCSLSGCVNRVFLPDRIAAYASGQLYWT